MLGPSIYHYDDEQEYEQDLIELENNADFTYLGHYNMLQDLYEELEYQGFTDKQITQLTHNRYGQCLEILHYNPDNEYVVFVGTR